MEEEKIEYCLVRDVQAPKRAGEFEAGIDFFIPRDLTDKDLIKANEAVKDVTLWPVNQGNLKELDTIHLNGLVVLVIDPDTNFIVKIILGPQSRVIIPSGVRMLIRPSYSMLMAANKSGISTKKGLIFSAEIVDSTYTGEVHIGLINTSRHHQSIEADSKASQFIHVPLIPSKLEHISQEVFDIESEGWSNRGSNWQGSTDKELKEGELFDIEPYNENVD